MKHPSREEIAGMKTGGDDPSTIAGAEERLKPEVKARELCRIIEEAFSGITLGEGIGLREGQGIDDYEDEATCASHRASDEKEDWRRIPAEELNRCNSSLSFFDAEGMRFHLPAFLICDLKKDCNFGMAFCLTYPTEYNKAKFSLLSNKSAPGGKIVSFAHRGGSGICVQAAGHPVRPSRILD